MKLLFVLISLLAASGVAVVARPMQNRNAYGTRGLPEGVTADLYPSLAFCMTHAYNASNLTPWTVWDYSLAGNRGSQSNTVSRPATTNAATYNALYFYGTTNKFYLSSAVNYNTTPFTLCAWIRTKDNGTTVLSNWGGVNDTGYYLGVRGGGLGCADFYLRESASVYRRKFGTRVLTNDTWRFVAAVSDGTRTTNGMSIYVDGGIEPHAGEQLGSTPSIASTTPPTIGATPAGVSIYKGYIGNLYIFSTNLNATQITNLYLSTKGKYGL